MDHNTVDIMLDIETLGTSPGCVILSVAAVKFPMPQGEVESLFYERISQDSCIESGLWIGDATIDWWSSQPVEAQKEAFGGTRRLEDVLLSLAKYIKDQGENVRVWGKGASFDAPILEAAYSICKLTVPWKYYNSMCYRTLAALYPEIPFEKPTIPHNALYDALAQARHASRIMSKMENYL